MLRTLFAIASGLLVMMVIYTIAAVIESKVYPVTIAGDVAAAVAALPTTGKVTIVSGWCLAALAGALVAGYIGEHRFVSALAIGVAMAIATLVNERDIPHPQWMVLVGTIAPVVLAWLATQMLPARARKLPPPKPWPKDAKID